MKKMILDVIAVFAITAIIAVCVFNGVRVFMAYRTQADTVEEQ